MKKRHETFAQIHWRYHPRNKTHALVFLARIANRVPRVLDEEVAAAIAPRVLVADPTRIELTDIADRSDRHFWETGKASITDEVRKLRQGNSMGPVGHLSVFGLAPIPLLVHLGAMIGNVIPVDLFQRHRDTEDWVWKTRGKPVTFRICRQRRGKSGGKVALVLSLSGTVDPTDAEKILGRSVTVYQIRPVSKAPSVSLVRMRRDLKNFQDTYIKTLSMVRTNHPGLSELHLFPAVPAPAAILLGREVLPKVDPDLVVYDSDKKSGGFTLTTKVHTR